MNKSTAMKYFHHTIRVFTGIFSLFLFGSKFGFFPSLATRPELFTSEGFTFLSAISATGYLFPIIGIFSLVCGLAFLANRYVAVAAIIMVPITLNFALFHIFLGFPVDSATHLIRELPSYVPLALILYLAYSERKKYAALLKP